MDQYLQTDNSRLCFSSFGETNQETILFIHGFPLSKETWEEQVKFLSPYFRIVTYDLCGLGNSSNETGFVTIDSHVADLIAILDFLKLKKVNLIGLSMGGYIALRAINLFPERFKSVILSNTRADADSNEVKEKRFAQIAALTSGGHADFAQGTSMALFSEDFRKTNFDKPLNLKKYILSQSKIGLCGNIMAMASRQDANSFLAKINLPVLVITGDNDNVIPNKEGLKMKTLIPEAQIYQIKEAGHLSNIEQPVVFSKKVKEFFES